MTKVTTNISFSQIMFILLVFFLSALIFFYLGAKFGSRILNVSGDAVQDSILPDEQMSREITEILKTKNHDFVFEDVLQSQKSAPILQPKLQETKKIEKTEVKPEKKVETEKKVEVEKKTVTPTVVKNEDNMAVKYAEPVVIDMSTQEPPVATSEPKYRLQLGSFGNKKDATVAQALWQRRGFDASIVSAEVKGKGKWFRLNVGGYPDLEAVKQAQMNVMSQYQESAKIIAIP